VERSWEAVTVHEELFQDCGRDAAATFVVEISLGAITANYRAVRHLVGPGVTLGVVKAVPPHGAVEIARVLERKAQRGWLFHAEEGVECAKPALERGFW
jgi:alanine racemase